MTFYGDHKPGVSWCLLGLSSVSTAHCFPVRQRRQLACWPEVRALRPARQSCWTTLLDNLDDWPLITGHLKFHVKHAL